MARKHPDWILTYNGAMYYDPANEEVQQYICDTVKEVVEKYDVDAIHFDDYFYPSNYPLPEGETREGAVAQERRDNVDTLIKKVYQTIKNTKASVEFGISPMESGKTAPLTRQALQHAAPKAIIRFTEMRKMGRKRLGRLYYTADLLGAGQCLCRL